MFQSRPSDKFKKKKVIPSHTSKYNLVGRITGFFGCTAPYGTAYKIYKILAYNLTCMCCIFWRGILVGALVMAIIFGGILWKLS